MSEHGEREPLRGVRLGSCVLEEPLGFGGMGAVYLARQERPHRQVAVKVLRPQGRVEPEAWRVFLARFRLEADATAALDHANIVPIYEFGEAGELAYLVMPYLPGGSLASLIAREGPLPVARAVDYCGQIGAALDYAHAHGVIHRDVKPSNLLLHPDGRLLLADFGIARLTGRRDMAGAGAAALERLPLDGWDGGLTQTGSAMGTPEYMAPEQVRGDPIGAAADIYALGIVTYVMLAATSPFAGGDINAVLRRQLVEPPMPLRPLRPDVSARVEEVVFWALAKDPADRPRKAGEFARALLMASRSRTLGGLPSWRAHAAGRLGASAIQTPPRVASVHARPTPQGTIPMPGLAPSSVLSSSSSEPAEEATRIAERGARSGALSNATARVGAASSARENGFPPSHDDATMAAAPPSPRLPDGRGVGSGGGAPLWPVDPDRPPRHHGSSGAKKAGIAAIIAGCVALILTAALVLAALNSSALGGGGATSTSRTPHPVAHATATATATATPKPTPTATPYPADWLAVSPASIKLGCSKDNKTATVTLANRGPSDLQWSATLSDSNYSLGVVVSPSQGTVASGATATITVTNRSWFGDKGDIVFTATDDNAGRPASLYFSASGCVGHG